MRVHDVVKVKAGKRRGSVGVVVAVEAGGGLVTVHFEGVSNGVGFVDVGKYKPGQLEKKS